MSSKTKYDIVLECKKCLTKLQPNTKELMIFTFCVCDNRACVAVDNVKNQSLLFG